MPKADRPAATATLKVDAELLTQARQIVAMKGGKLAEYFDSLVREPIQRDHADLMRRIAADHGPKKNKEK